MAKVLSIRKIRKKPRCKLTLDSGDFFNLSIDLIVKYKLKKHQDLSQDELNRILSEQKIIDCKQAAYAYASYKPRTEKQVIDKLNEKGFENSQINQAVKFLYEFDLLDDRRFAAGYVQNILRRKAVGKFKISQNLSKKGINTNIIEEIIEKHYPHTDTLNLAFKAAEKKMRLISNKEKHKQKQSLISFLKGQGFDWDTIKQVSDKLFPKN